MKGVQFAMGPELPSNKVNFIGKQFSGSTVGIIGMGRIGESLARKALGFGCRILYHNRRKKSVEFNGNKKGPALMDV